MRQIGKNIVKYTLFIFNFLFAISGLGILIAGSLVLSNVHEFKHFLEDRVVAPPIVLIVTGAIIFLIASLGCFGAIKESPNLLVMFAGLLLVVLIIELACGFAAVSFQSDLEMALKGSLEKTIARSSKEDLFAWDNTQKRLMCCGVTAPSDWIDLSLNKTLRSSCCRAEYVDPETKDCRNAFPLFKDKYYQDGCVMKLKEKVDENATILIGVGIGIAFLQILGIILALYLAKTIRQERVK